MPGSRRKSINAMWVLLDEVCILIKFIDRKCNCDCYVLGENYQFVGTECHVFKMKKFLETDGGVGYK